MVTGFKQLNASAKLIIPSFKGRIPYDSFNYAMVWIVCLILLAVLVLCFDVFIALMGNNFGQNSNGINIGFVLAYIFGLVVLVFSFVSQISLFVRRLHDTGRSGHWMWLHLAGAGIVPLLFSFADSGSDNRYGEGYGTKAIAGFGDLKKAFKDAFIPMDARLTYKEYSMSVTVLSFIFSIISAVLSLCFCCYFIILYFSYALEHDMQYHSARIQNFEFAFNDPSFYIMSGIMGAIFVVFAVLFIRLSIRRLHDTGRSGHTFWWSLIPVFGICVPLLLIFCDSDGNNEYGPAKIKG